MYPMKEILKIKTYSDVKLSNKIVYIAQRMESHNYQYDETKRKNGLRIIDKKLFCQMLPNLLQSGH